MAGKGLRGPSFPKGQPRIPGSADLPSAPDVPSLGNFSSSSSVRLRDMQGRFTKGGWGFQFEGLEGLFSLPGRYEKILGTVIETGLNTIKEAMERYAKENAPWEDRTGAAREGLKTVMVADPKSGRYIIYLGYSVDYGVYLETSNGGAFAIVGPTVRHFAPLVAAKVLEDAPK